MTGPNVFGDSNVVQLDIPYTRRPADGGSDDHGGGKGGGGTIDGMEPRFAAIEGRLSVVEDRLTRVEVKLDHMDGRLGEIKQELGQMKWWFIGTILTIVLTVLGTGIGIQQMTVTTFQAAAQQGQQPPAPIVIQVPAPPAAPPAK